MNSLEEYFEKIKFTLIINLFQLLVSARSQCVQPFCRRFPGILFAEFEEICRNLQTDKVLKNKKFKIMMIKKNHFFDFVKIVNGKYVYAERQIYFYISIFNF